MIHLSQPPENMNSIRERYGIVGTALVMSFVGNHWATGRLCVFDLAGPPDFRDQVNIWQQFFVPPSEGPMSWSTTTRSGGL